MRALPLLIIVLLCAGVAWFLVTGRGEDEEPSPQALAPDPTRPPKPPPPAPLPKLRVTVLPKEPNGLWPLPEEESGKLFDPQLLNAPLRWPGTGHEVLTGELALQGIQKGLDTKFFFAGQEALDAFKGMKFPEAPPLHGMINVQHVLGALEGRGWHLVERDGGMWVINVEGRD